MRFTKTSIASCVAALFAVTPVLAQDLTIDTDTSVAEFYAPESAVSNNTVSVTGVPTGHTGDLIINGGRGDETVEGNTLRVSGVTYSAPVFNLYGGYTTRDEGPSEAVSQTLSNNMVSIVNSTLTAEGNERYHSSLIIGAGKRQTGTGYLAIQSKVSNNSVTINNTTLEGPFEILGGAGAIVENNSVTLNQGNDFTEGNIEAIYGGRGVSATGNRINFNGGTYDIAWADVAGGAGWNEAKDNYVVIAQDTSITHTAVDEDDADIAFIAGGSSAVYAENNNVSIGTTGRVDAMLVGAVVEPVITVEDPATVMTATAKGNTVNVNAVGADSRLSAAGVGFDFLGTFKATATSQNNTVIVSPGVSMREVSATFAVVDNGNDVTINESGNKIDITEATVGDVTLVRIEHAAVAEGAAPRVTVNLNGSSIELENAVVTGTLNAVKIADGISKTVTGTATLGVTGINRVGKLGEEFKQIDVRVGPENAMASTAVPVAYSARRMARASTENAVLTFTESQNLNGVNVNVIGLAGTTSDNDYNIFGTANDASVTLTGNMTFTGTFQEVTQTINTTLDADNPTLTASEVISGEANNGTPTAPVVTLTGNVKTLSESLLGSMALVNQGVEFMANEGMNAIVEATAEDGVSAFGAIHGGSVRYETGSYVDLDGGSLVLGGALKNGDTTLAAFFETGWADSESHVQGATSDGDHSYYGVGVAARQTLNSPFYLEGSARLGMAKTEFNGLYASTGEKAHYDAKAKYASLHIGAGYLFKLTDDVTLDAYAKYMYTYLGSDKVGLGTSGGEKLKLDSTKAHIVQMGVRAKGQMTENAAWRVGAAYEHVFDGDANSAISANGLAPMRIEAPSIEGNTGILEVGMTVKPRAESAWSFDLGAKGYVGDRKGVTGSMQAVYRF